MEKTLRQKHHPHKPDCVGCHMPRTNTADVAHTQATDHRILRRPPAAFQEIQTIRHRSPRALPARLHAGGRFAQPCLAWESHRRGTAITGGRRPRGTSSTSGHRCKTRRSGPTGRPCLHGSSRRRSQGLTRALPASPPHRSHFDRRGSQPRCDRCRGWPPRRSRASLARRFLSRSRSQRHRLESRARLLSDRPIPESAYVHRAGLGIQSGPAPRKSPFARAGLSIPKMRRTLRQPLNRAVATYVRISSALLYFVTFAISAEYGSIVNSFGVAARGFFRLVSSTLSFGEANPSPDKSSRTFCSAADIFSTTSTASSL